MRVLEIIEDGGAGLGFWETGRKLGVITGGGWRWDDELGTRVARAVEGWCKVGMGDSGLVDGGADIDDGTLVLFRELDVVILGTMAGRILDLIALNPK